MNMDKKDRIFDYFFVNGRPNWPMIVISYIVLTAFVSISLSAAKETPFGPIMKDPLTGIARVGLGIAFVFLLIFLSQYGELYAGVNRRALLVGLILLSVFIYASISSGQIQYTLLIIFAIAYAFILLFGKLFFFGFNIRI